MTTEKQTIWRCISCKKKHCPLSCWFSLFDYPHLTSSVKGCLHLQVKLQGGSPPVIRVKKSTYFILFWGEITPVKPISVQLINMVVLHNSICNDRCGAHLVDNIEISRRRFTETVKVNLMIIFHHQELWKWSLRTKDIKNSGPLYLKVP